MTEKFSDFGIQEPIYPDTERKSVEELKGKEIMIKECNFLPSSFGGDFVVVLFEMGGKDYSTAIGSKVIVDQLKRFKGKLPFLATIMEKKSKDGRMYQILS